jgi:hypothetical protein
MNILEKANQIVNLRSEEPTRNYGPYNESMERAAKILSEMTGVTQKPELIYQSLIAIKLSRESYGHKEDNLLDAVAYMGALNNYIHRYDLEDHEITHLKL